jgi:hypothetical protein
MDTLKKAENATVWETRPLILNDLELAAQNFSVSSYHVQLYPTKAQAILLESISAAAAGCTIT